MFNFFSVSILPFTALVMRKITYFQYLYYDYFTVILIPRTEANTLIENQLIIFTLILFSNIAQLTTIYLQLFNHCFVSKIYPFKFQLVNG